MPTPPQIDDAAAHHLASLRRLTLVIAWVVAAAGMLNLIPAGAVIAPIGIALLIGLPHGAVDHLTLVRGGKGPARVLGTIGYATAAAATFVLVDLVPMVAWTGFILLSVWHFGTADREYLGMVGRRPSMAFALAAGSIPVAGLMARGMEQIAPLASALDPAVNRLLTPTIAGRVGVSLLGLTAIAILVEVRARRWHAVTDLGALSLLVLTVPPVWAFGIYFGLWHSLRHAVRMVSTEEPWTRAMRKGGPRAAWRRFAVDAATPTLIAVGAMAALAALGRNLGGTELTAIALQVTAAITVPHVATVAFLDRRSSKPTLGADNQTMGVKATGDRVLVTQR